MFQAGLGVCVRAEHTLKQVVHKLSNLIESLALRLSAGAFSKLQQRSAYLRPWHRRKQTDTVPTYLY